MEQEEGRIAAIFLEPDDAQNGAPALPPLGLVAVEPVSEPLIELIDLGRDYDPAV